MRIVPANMTFLTAFKSYVDECVDSDIDSYQFVFNNYQGFLKKRIAYSQGHELPNGWPPISTYFCIQGTTDITENTECEILGSIRVRHGDNAYIENVIGHVGYETKPSARGLGVAKYMLAWVQDNVLTGNAIITCAVTNEASRKVIESSGAKYLNNFYCVEEDNEVIRYQLSHSYTNSN